jgi:hypothetical protein
VLPSVVKLVVYMFSILAFTLGRHGVWPMKQQSYHAQIDWH